MYVAFLLDSDTTRQVPGAWQVLPVEMSSRVCRFCIEHTRGHSEWNVETKKD